MRVYVGGTFDLFHHGHVEFLKRCNQLGEVWVSLNTDEFAARYKRPPILTLEERTKVLYGCRYVTEVLVNEGDENSRPAILRVKPRYIIHGSDWTGWDLMQQMGIDKDFLRENHIAFVYQPYTEGISTGEIIERCQSRADRYVPREARQHASVAAADLPGVDTHPGLHVPDVRGRG